MQDRQAGLCKVEEGPAESCGHRPSLHISTSPTDKQKLSKTSRKMTSNLKIQTILNNFTKSKPLIYIRYSTLHKYKFEIFRVKCKWSAIAQSHDMKWTSPQHKDNFSSTATPTHCEQNNIRGLERADDVTWRCWVAADNIECVCRMMQHGIPVTRVMFT